MNTNISYWTIYLIKKTLNSKVNILKNRILISKIIVKSAIVTIECSLLMKINSIWHFWSNFLPNLKSKVSLFYKPNNSKKEKRFKFKILAKICNMKLLRLMKLEMEMKPYSNMSKTCWKDAIKRNATHATN